MCVYIAGETEGLLEQWIAAEAEMSKDEFDTFRLEWNRNLICRVRISAVDAVYVSTYHTVLQLDPCAGQGHTWCEWHACHAFQQCGTQHAPAASE
jgi:hypothetical protein